MKTYIDCFPCFFEQAIRAGRMATDDERVLKRLVDELGMMLREVSLDSSPPETGRYVYQLVSRVTGNLDPYSRLKRESTKQALALYPTLKKTIEESEDSLLTAIRVAIAGNVIDLGASAGYNIEQAVEEVLDQEFAICDYSAFKAHLERADHILYIGDNAGEAVFDRLLIEQMNKPATFVVREKPVINDVIFEDARQAGLDGVATIVSSGTDAPGAILSTCSEEFREMLAKAEFVIAKGQGNYEGLSNEARPVFFLLKAKCRIIAEDIGVSRGDIILKAINV